MIRVGIDCDGVLGDFLGGCQQMSAVGPGTSYADLCTFWDDEAGLWRQIDRMGPAFHRNLFRPISGAAVAMGRLLADPELEVWVVTSPPKQSQRVASWCADRTDWLVEHFGIHEERITYMRDKTGFDGDVLIDDYVKQLERFRAKGRGVIRFEQPWNEGHNFGHVLRGWRDPETIPAFVKQVAAQARSLQ